jgi:hypothetical protein
MAKSCRAFLINIEKKKPEGTFDCTIYSDILQLHWSVREDKGQKKGTSVLKQLDIGWGMLSLDILQK